MTHETTEPAADTKPTTAPAPNPESRSDVDMLALREAFDLFTRTTESMEESYRRLETRLESLDQELQEKNQKLELATDYLNSILESMSDGVIAVDTKGIITTFNHAASDILGHRVEQVLGRSYRDVFGADFPMTPGRRPVDIRHSDGTTLPVSERCSTITDVASEVLGTVIVFQDLSEIEALREQVRRKDRLSAIGEMAATVAHEIRNPLGGLRGFAALLERDIEPDDPRARLVKKILAGTRQLDRVVNELLEYTRPVDLELTKVDCAKLVESAMAYAGVDTREVRIRNEVGPKIYVYADADKLRQVVLNILLNAVQSVNGAGGVTITATQGVQLVDIRISDTGCGIPEDSLDRVFSPFYTTKEKGTGLGLAVASKTIESHGGSIELESEVGRGSTFIIRLPRST